jgi:hypothetical protein
LSRTVELLLKPDPLTVMAVLFEPLVIAVGEIAETTGARL